MDDEKQEALEIRIHLAQNHLEDSGNLVNHHLNEIKSAADELIADHRTMKFVSHMAMDFITAIGLHEEFSLFVQELRDNAEKSDNNVIPFVKK